MMAQERFGFTDEEKLLQQMARRLAREKVAPGAAQRDIDGEFAYDMLELMKENGLLGIDFPSDYGGMDAGLMSLCIVIEELAKVDAATSMMPSTQELGSLPIILAGNHDQKKEFLQPLATGEKLSSFALTESRGGSDVAALRTRAKLDGDKYILNGTKTFITNGGVADIVTVYAITNPDAPAHKAASVFVLEKGMAGFVVGKKESKMGIRSSETRELIFDDVEVPVENRLGNEGDGFHIMMKTLDFTRPAVAAQAIGIAQGAFEYALQYAKGREAFGKPVIKHQAVGSKLADMSMRISAGRQLIYKTCDLLQAYAKKDLSKLSPEIIRYSSMSKAFCSDVAMWTTTEAVQILGGYGYCTEYPVERYMRDAKITQIYEGTNEIQRVVITSTL